MAFKTRITDLLEIEYPVVQGGMQGVGTAELASAVSNAGGLGILTALTQPTPDALRDEIERTRSMTSKPIGVNMTIFPTINSPDVKAGFLVHYGDRQHCCNGGAPPGKIIIIGKAGGTMLTKKVAEALNRSATDEQFCLTVIDDISSLAARQRGGDWRNIQPSPLCSPIKDMIIGQIG
jgi:NAD(P)H-dependent flavin oxidoreductase YrpB (nitropropane dioxygenase family)